MPNFNLEDLADINEIKAIKPKENVTDSNGTNKPITIYKKANFLKFRNKPGYVYYGQSTFSANGYGLLKTPTLKYKGGFKDGLFHGYGELKYRDRTYLGHFVKGERHGYGMLKRTGLPSYVKGKWFDGVMDTTLINVVHNEFTYIGPVPDDKGYSNGKLLFTNGDIYTGDILNLLSHGEGVYYSNYGYTFRGKFNDGSKVSGVYDYGKGETIAGRWINNRFYSSSKKRRRENGGLHILSQCASKVQRV